MTRGIGVVTAFRDLPPEAILLAGIATQLGDVWWLFVVSAGVIVLGRRRPGLTTAPIRTGLVCAGLVLTAYASVMALKAILGLPRPPGAGTATPPAWLPAILTDGYGLLVTGAGYGFPSGHATQSTLVYGGLAWLLSAGTRRQRGGLAAGLVLVVGTSRLVLGVHYVVDVVAGAALGLVLLGVYVAAVGRRPRRALGVATAFGILAVLADPALKTGLAALTAAGLLGAWELAARRSTPQAA